MFTTISSFNESMDNLLDSTYFSNYNTLVFSISSDIDDETPLFFQKLRETFNLDNSLGSSTISHIISLAKEESQYVRITKYNRRDYFEWGYSPLKSLGIYALKEELTYKRVFTYNEIKNNLNTILKYGDVTPSYAPKKFDRTLERNSLVESLRMPKNIQMFLSQSPWDVVIFRFNTRAGLNRTKEFIEQFNIFHYAYPISGAYPVDVYMVLKNSHTLKKNNLYEVSQDYYDSGDFQKNFPPTIICPTVLVMDYDTEKADNLFNTFIFKSFPDYKPKKMDRSIDVNEAFENKIYDIAVFKALTPEENKLAQEELFKRGYGWSNSIRKEVREFDIMDYPIYIFAEYHLGMNNELRLEHMKQIGLNHYDGINKYVAICIKDGEKICPTIFNYDDVKFLDIILKSGLLTPSYAPKKFDRTLERSSLVESIEYKRFKYEEILFEVNDKDELDKIEKLLKEVCKEVIIEKIKIRCYPVCLSICPNDTKKDNVCHALICNYHTRSEMNKVVEINKEYYPKIMILSDWYQLKNIMLTGSEGPNYAPRKIIRESVNSNVINYRIWCDNREKAVACEKFLHDNGYRWSSSSDYIIRDNPSCFNGVQTYSDIDTENKTFGGYTDYNMDNYIQLTYPEDMVKIKTVLGLSPSYEPKKFDRTIESKIEPKQYFNHKTKKFTIYPFRFKTEEEFIEEFGDRWASPVDWGVSSMNYLFGQDFKSFDPTATGGNQDGWHINRKMLIENDNDYKPSYKPKKFDRTLESFNNNVLNAFDLDGTLVYSKRFEETIKPLLEFVTPESILNKKIDEIGVQLKDLKYEHGRIYFNDPMELFNVIGNQSWVRKGSRIYLIQPDEYLLTSESMPIGVYNKIVDLYNRAENKIIITSRSEKFREQTEAALERLGIEIPNYGLFMYPKNTNVTASMWKAMKLKELYIEYNFNQLNYYDDNRIVIKKIKEYLNREINITFYKVKENNYIRYE